MQEHHDDGEPPGLAVPAGRIPDRIAPLVTHGGPPAAVTPSGSETADVASAGRIDGQREGDSPDSAGAEHAARKRQAEKDDATLIAEFALAGIELVKMADGTWLAQRWGMFRPLPTTEDARAWLARVAGKSA
jgi:hypothetical protein